MKQGLSKRISRAQQTELGRHDGLAADFIRVELELADTFCKLAVDSHSSARARQHRTNARRAFEAAVHRLAQVDMEKAELDPIIVKIEEVKAMLESLEGHSRPNC